jgi:hypothetical protein
LSDGTITFTTDTGDWAYTGTVIPAVPAKHIAFWGDSMTWSDGGYYPNKVGALTGLPVYNGGIGGQTSSDIAARAGGFLITGNLTGGQIAPDTTYVTVTNISPTGDWRMPGSTGAWFHEVTLMGVPGTLKYDMVDGSWRFKRTTAGSAVAVPNGSPFIFTSPQHKDSISVMWLGRNNIWSNQTGDWKLGMVKRDNQAIIDTRTPLNKRYIVMGQINAVAENTSATGSNKNLYDYTVRINEELETIHGPNFLNIRREFIDRGLQVAGITPTAEDQDAIAKDAPPPSLMNIAGDHPSIVGYETIGALVAEHIISKGWTL